MWLRRRWIHVRVQKFIAKTKAWSLYRHRNIQRACRQQAIKGPGTMNQDELDAEKGVCRIKLKELQNEASYLCASFL